MYEVLVRSLYMFRFFKRIRFIINLRKFVPFLKDFFLSKEVKRSKKLLSIGILIGYALLPFDIVPDFLTFFGIMDDLAVFTFIVHRMIEIAPTSIQEKYDLTEN